MGKNYNVITLSGVADRPLMSDVLLKSFIKVKYNYYDNGDGIILFGNEDSNMTNVLFLNKENEVSFRISDTTIFKNIFDFILENQDVKNKTAAVVISYINCNTDFIADEIKRLNGKFSDDIVSTCDIIFGDTEDTVLRMQINLLFHS